MYYFVYYINIIWTSINSHFKERTRFYSLMVLNRAGDVPAADWLSQTQVKNSRDLSRVVIRFFSVVEIPIKQSSFYNKQNDLLSKLSVFKFYP